MMVSPGTNGAVEYGLLEDGGVFDIDPSTGYLSLTSTLDTETTPRYILSSPPHTSHCSHVGLSPAINWWWRHVTEALSHAALTPPYQWTCWTSMTTNPSSLMSTLMNASQY